MKRLLLPLMGSILCAALPQSAAADPAVPLQTKPGEEVHAAVSDMPDIIDMSHADPRTWHSLPAALPGAYEIAENRRDRGNG